MTVSYLNRRGRHFNLIFHLFPTLLFAVFSGCSSLPTNSYARNIAKRYALEAVTPELEKFYVAQAPIQPVSVGAFEVVPQLPGGAFKPSFQKSSFAYDSNGILQLGYGDYIIPVMTYCMKVAGGSPSAIIYSLSRLQGTRANLIKELNQKALPQFPPSEIQILSWSLQAGLSYDDFTPQSGHVFDIVLPNRKDEIKDSFLKMFQDKWNQISEKTNGLFPNFEEASDDFLKGLGSFGNDILILKNFQKNLNQYGDDYPRLSAIINIDDSIGPVQETTGWSKINDQVYARFLTSGHFQDIGQIQIRIVDNQKRKPSTISHVLLPVDISSWLADPNDFHIQPLSFSIILSNEGLLLVPQIADAPIIAVALLSGILAAQVIDWDSFNQLKNFLSDVKDFDVRNLIRNGDIALNKAYDDLEKPARDAGVIDKNTQKSKQNAGSSTREYNKSGGAEQLEKDFDKIPGQVQVAQDGIPIKELPDGKTVVKRPEKNQTLPTLEIQPAETGVKGNDRIRIKVRYNP